MTQDIAFIRESLAELRALDPDLQLFSARRHRHELRAPLDVGAVEEIERRMGGPLPNSYRAFVTRVGDGGAGPYYGILPLRDAVARIAENWGEEALRGRFPLTEDVDFGSLLGRCDDWKEHVRRLEEEPGYQASWDRLQAEHLTPAFHSGVLPICDYGCGDYYFMVVRGERPGTVWVNSLDSSTGLYSLRVDFLEFYRRWLDDGLVRVRAKNFEPRNARYSYLQFGDNPRYKPVDRTP